MYTTSAFLVTLLDLDVNDLWYGPYLNINPHYVEKWKKILPEKFITIRWQGNQLYEYNVHRNLPLSQLISTVKKNIPPDTHIVSLQIDKKYKQNNVINADIKNWFDTMAIQHLAQLNITSCTSTAHSAGAINAKCVVLPPVCTYYPWVSLKEDYTSYWYDDTLKVYAQTKWKNWSNPLKLLANEIKHIC